MLTCIFCTAAGHAEMSGYSLAVGLAIAQAFEQRGVRFQLKWPNDLVVVQGQAVRKLGGILIEVEEYQGRRVLLVGLGINVRQVPSEVSDIAISLAELCRDTICRDEVVQIVASAALVNHRSFFESGGFSRVQSAWEDRSCFEIGQTELTLETGAGQVKGLYAGVSQSGALTLCRDDEQRQVFHSGHIASSGGVFKDLSKRC
jgi:BirA family biotin operon repressor/biotin-[acetyl-CoA-carboxylase] ligase